MKTRFVLSLLLLWTAGNTSPGMAQPAARWSEIDNGLPSTSFGIRSLVIDPAKPSTLYALTVAGVIFKSTDAGGTWRSSPTIVEVNFLAIAPKTSALFAITGRGVVKSLDGGENWKTATAGLPSGVMSLAISPSDPSTLFALTFTGVFKSSNSGENWSATGLVSSTTPPVFSALFIDPSTASTLYGLRYNHDIVKSTDGGETWTVINPAVDFLYGVTSFVIDPLNPSTIYAGFFPWVLIPDGGSPTGGVLKSTDSGKTWIALQQVMPASFFPVSLAIDPLTPSTIYAGVTSNTGGGMARSTDGGQSWTAMNDGLTGNCGSTFAIDPKTPSTVYSGCPDDGAGGLFKSTQGGANWKPTGAGLTRIDARVLTVDPSNAILYAGLRDKLFKSSDEGASWTNLNSFQIAAQPVPPGGVVIPFGAGTANVHSLLVNSINPNVLYVETTRAGGCAYIDKVVFKSTDAGTSWDDNVSPPDSGCDLGGYQAFATVMAIDPLDPDTLYLGETEDEDGIYALLRSSDGGAHWTSIWDYTNGLQSGLNVVAVDPGNRATLYAGVGDAGSAGTGVFKSTDGGATWNVTGLKDSAATVLVIDRGVLYAGTQGIYTDPKGFRGLFKSTDGGASWLAASTGLDGLTDIGAAITALVISPDHSNILYAGTSGGGIYKSVDGAASWVKFNDGLTSMEIRALAIAAGSPNKLYAATSSGVFRIADEASAP